MRIFAIKETEANAFCQYGSNMNSFPPWLPRRSPGNRMLYSNKSTSLTTNPNTLHLQSHTFLHRTLPAGLAKIPYRRLVGLMPPSGVPRISFEKGDWRLRWH